MFYISFLQIANKFHDRLSVNQYTYSELLDVVSKRSYVSVSISHGMDVLLDLLVAAKHNKPLVVLPKENRNNVIMPDNLPNSFCLVLYSSGSTGSRKPIVIPETMLLANIENILQYNNITEHDKILTVCSTNHTAGLTCQTLAGIFAGAHVIIEQFNAFSLLRLLREHNITITHIVPIMTKAIMKLTDKINLPNLKLVWMGSDCIPKSHVEFWLSKNTNVMTVYGMTESGPPAISHIYKYGDDLSMFDNGYPVGTKVFSDYKIIDNELVLKGDNINIDDWFYTGDCFKMIDDYFFYTGRKSAGNKIVPKGRH